MFMYTSVRVYIPAHRLYAKLRVPWSRRYPSFTASFTGTARLKFPDPEPRSRSRARRSGLGCAPFAGVGAVPAARALWRGAPCPAAAELHRRRRGQSGPGAAGSGAAGSGAVGAGGCGAGPGRDAGGGGGGGAARLRAGDPESQRFLTGLVPPDLQSWAHEAVVGEGLPPPLAVFIYVANKRRGGANAW